ncbi:putative electron transfer flavoprotein subunit, partial [Sarracenia purpurea var. burkii]
ELPNEPHTSTLQSKSSKFVNLPIGVVTISMGPSSCVDTQCIILAMGTNRGVHAEAGDTFHPLAVAKLLKAFTDVDKPQLLNLGKQAIDDDSNQTGQMVAGLLNWPHKTFGSKVVLDKQK